MSVMAWVYIAYIAVCTTITLWVGAVLRRNGATFVGHGTDLPEPLIKSMTHLLTVGFYLVNFGLIAFALKSERAAATADTAIELASTKIGGVTLLIGAMHFVMLLIFSKLRHSEVLEPLTSRTTPPKRNP